MRTLISSMKMRFKTDMNIHKKTLIEVFSISLSVNVMLKVLRSGCKLKCQALPDVRLRFSTLMLFDIFYADAHILGGKFQYNFFFSTRIYPNGNTEIVQC